MPCSLPSATKVRNSAVLFRISDFFAKKGQEELDAMWERGEMTEEKLKSFETLHERTPYRR